jgi:hypothetical protein
MVVGMTLQQTINIPANRRVSFDFLAPQEIPIGTAKVAIAFDASPKPPAVAKKGSFDGLLALRGSCEGLDTLDAYFERKRADKRIEDEQLKRRYGSK